MKIDRLIGIVTILLQKDKTTAPELAERFEVSRRTIIRDIDILSRAGIPVVTTQGAGGGISIMKGYRIDRALLSLEDMNSILIGLKSLDSISETKRYRQLMDKISVDSFESSACNNINIDLSGWNKSFISKKIELIKFSIEQKEKIAFKYFSPTGESDRVIEPYQIIFQWSSWYVWGYCIQKQDYRMFKLTRMTGLKRTGEQYGERNVPEYVCKNTWNDSGKITASAKFDKSVKWRIIDEFGVDNFHYDENGNILLNYTWSSLNSFFQHILSFGDKAEILEPIEYRKEFFEFLKKIQNKY